ncbi:histidine kinase [Magnetococcus marinus MC-1]|uniref:histidine kinase n=1 Tax=Magnetococcus marinus (strain ATCC BAA-1437 / JCM 17883 / MC-1) TaxID=156889 RepID=A0LC73_MAGMM|nr:ATP-binding protein [Magnetococcus marinus]ABK45566.1 histidine kinase [Magnetococcus marinus MC-1]
MIHQGEDGVSQDALLGAMLAEHQDEILQSWIRHIVTHAGMRQLEKAGEAELRRQAAQLWAHLVALFEGLPLEDTRCPAYGDVVIVLREMSGLRAEQGFSPMETCQFVFLLKDALLPLLQRRFADHPELFTWALIRLNRWVDRLGMITFECYMESRERTIMEQSRAMVALAESSNRTKSMFLAAMSHEIRTPLHAINGLAELLEREELNQDQKHYVHIIYRAGSRLLALINDILDFSRLEAGRIELESLVVEVRPLVHETMEMLSFKAKDKGLALQWTLEPQVPQWMMSDPTRLGQVLVNLVGNAIKFTQSGEVALEISVAEQQLCVMVRDTGLGIAEDKQQIIFEPFSQSDITISRRFGGTGLGLSITKQIVALMGGTISVQSRLGEGSRFYVRLPLKEVAAGDLLAAQQATQEVEVITLPTLNILLAEDTLENRVLFRAFLKHCPWAIDEAKDGAEALIKFTTGHYDLVLMDVEMPIMDGYAATQAIRAWERAQQRVATPILALTAHALSEYRQQSINAGCNGHVVKPLGKRDLIEAIRQAVTPPVQGG